MDILSFFNLQMSIIVSSIFFLSKSELLIEELFGKWKY
jgi:hypothetical protein